MSRVGGVVSKVSIIRGMHAELQTPTTTTTATTTTTLTPFTVNDRLNADDDKERAIVTLNSYDPHGLVGDSHEKKNNEKKKKQSSETLEKKELWGPLHDEENLVV